MQGTTWRVGSCWTILASCWLGGAATAGPPTISLEAVALNNDSLIPPKDHIAAAPGDVIVAQVFLSGWSPNGEKLRGYQATLSHMGFVNAEGGSVKPVGYDDAIEREAENPDHALIDRNHPDFVFKGQQAVAILDTLAYDYRFLGVLVEHDKSLVCPNPDRKYYAGTVHLKVSEDARGTFQIGFLEAEWATVMNDVNSAAIIPLHYGSLTVEVPADGRVPLRIARSDPPHGGILATQVEEKKGAAVQLDFNAEVRGASPGDFTLEDGSENPPKITQLVTAGKTVKLMLDRPLRSCAWTMVTHTPSGTQTRIGSLPGDVNGDGKLTSTDLTALLSGASNSDEPLPLFRSDINGDGAFDLHDVMKLVELLNEPQVYRASIKEASR